MHYWATVLPFGGVHTDARRKFDTMVERRLAKNLRLKRELASGLEIERVKGSAALPIEVDALWSLFGQVAQGLLWHHTRSYLPATHEAIAFTPPDEVVGSRRSAAPHAVSRLSPLHQRACRPRMGRLVELQKGAVRPLSFSASVCGARSTRSRCLEQ
jgi:hypothetical protein